MRDEEAAEVDDDEDDDEATEETEEDEACEGIHGRLVGGGRADPEGVVLS